MKAYGFENSLFPFSSRWPPVDLRFDAIMPNQNPNQSVERCCTYNVVQECTFRQHLKCSAIIDASLHTYYNVSCSVLCIRHRITSPIQLIYRVISSHWPVMKTKREMITFSNDHAHRSQSNLQQYEFIVTTTLHEPR